VVPSLPLLLAFGLSLLQAAPSAPTARQYGRANKEEIHAYVMLIRLRWDLYGRWKASGKWPDDPDANRALEEHSRYWSDQLHEGRALLAGGMNGDYWDNVALVIFEAKSEAEAQSIAANDPAVKAFVSQVQVRPFDVHFVTDKFGGH
jgi:uncharacterized protein YciI